MASWTKYLRAHTSTKAVATVTAQNDSASSGSGTSAKFSSFLPEVYAGHPNRIQRYSQYEEMNRDSFVGAALDTIAEFCTQSEDQSDNPFEPLYNETPSDTESKIMKEMLTKWINLNDFPSKMFSIFRNTLMNGDSFYLRDPETGEWTFLDHYSVIMAKVDENDGRKISEYLLKGLEDFRMVKYASANADLSQFRGPNGASPLSSGGAIGGGGGAFSGFQMAGSDRDGRSNNQKNLMDFAAVDSKNIIHLSMSDGLDINWPFGPSVLERVFKVWKQKEMLEDAILIYRVVRAPERRVFYIDIGQMNPVMAKAHVEGIKNEIHQRRIPNRNGGGSSMLDAAHNPLSMLDDYFLATSSEGRGSKIEVLPGGDSVGEITDLSYFRRELALGFRIPNTYLPYGDDQSGAAYNDGKVSTASIQEFLFTKYCMRLQNRLAPAFDADFKRFLKESGVEIEPGMFRLKFCPPQNFTKYRQIELDNQQVNLLSQVSGMKDVSKRFAKKKYGGWTEDEILENERMWAEENPKKVHQAAGATIADSNTEGDLSSVGVRGGMGGDPFGGDMGMDEPPADGAPIDGAANDTGDASGAISPIGPSGGGAAPPPPAA